MAISADQFYQDSSNSCMLTPPNNKIMKAKSQSEILHRYAKNYSVVHSSDYSRYKKQSFKRFNFEFSKKKSFSDNRPILKYSTPKKTKLISENLFKNDKHDFISNESNRNLCPENCILKSNLTANLPLPTMDEEVENVDPQKQIAKLSAIDLVYESSSREKSFPIRQVESNKPPGLNNLGNTCYINAVVQVLFTNKFFMDDLIKYCCICQDGNFEWNFSEEIKQTAPIVFSLIDLYENRTQVTVNEYLRNFKNIIEHNWKNFNSGAQHDAAELFALLLDRIRDELKMIHNGDIPRNPVDRNFNAKLLYEDRCHKCFVVKRQIHNNISLILSLTSDRNIQSAFLKLLNCETVESKCEKCQSNFIQNKYFNDLPKVLCLQMPRCLDKDVKDEKNITAPPFLYLPKKFLHKQVPVSPLSTPYKKSLSKFRDTISHGSLIPKRLIFDVIDRPTGATEDDGEVLEPVRDELDIFSDSQNDVDTLNEAVSHQISFTINESECERYQLVSVICHHGSAVTAGHYTSYVFNFENNSWFHMNDEMVLRVKYEEVEKEILPIGYIYFYVHSNG